MTPKEKAKYLVFEFTKLHTNNQSYVHDIYCALIAVDEILNELFEISLVTGSSYVHKHIDYYQEVKNQINKL